MTVRTARLIRRKSQKDVAAALGLSQSAFARIETGKTSVTLERARVIADLLDVSLDDLFFGDDSSLLRLERKEDEE